MLSLQKILTRSLSVHFLKRMSSSTAAATAKATSDIVESNDAKGTTTTSETKKERNSLVAAVFQSLKDETLAINLQSPKAKDETKIKEEKSKIGEKILKAKSVNGILSVVENSGPITRKDALKIVSILSEWSSTDRIQLSEFENDARFLKICRLLGRTVSKSEKNDSNKLNPVNDFNMVLGIAGDDEAAKLVSSITIPQMIKVMSSLAQKKRRSISLLRSLAFNISSSSEQLNLKQCGDILYSMASLNFLDSVLTAKVCADILAEIPKHTEKSAAIGSILTSLGLLKYRDTDVLECLFDWILKNCDNCRPQDIQSMFLTFGVLNYKVNNLDGLIKLVNSINESDLVKKTDFLNYVWALSLLRLANEKHIETVLSPSFINNLTEECKELTPNSKMKLLNINGYAKFLIQNYKGPFLSPDSDVYSVPLSHSKPKQILLNGMLDALKSLFPSTTCIKSLVDSKMGFLIDAECALDKKRNPIPLDKINNEAIKVAIMVIDFHDTCHGPNRSTTGLTNLVFDLLEESNYKILPVLYSEFSTSDKLLKRVQYLEANLKKIVKFKD